MLAPDACLAAHEHVRSSVGTAELPEARVQGPPTARTYHARRLKPRGSADAAAIILAMRPLWAPSAERIARARTSPRSCDQRRTRPSASRLRLPVALSVLDRTARRISGATSGTSAAFAATMGERVVDRSRPDAGRAVLPGCAAQFRREPAAAPRRRAGDRSSTARDAAGRSATAELYAAVARFASALRERRRTRRRPCRRRTSRTCPRRSSPRSARRRSARCGRRARRTSACRACSIGSVRSSRGCSSPPTAISTAARRTTSLARVARGRRRAADASSTTVDRSLRGHARRSTACATPCCGATSSARGDAPSSRSSRCRSTIRSTSSIRRAPPAFPSASCTAPAARCSSTSRNISSTATSGAATASSTSRPAAG